MIKSILSGAMIAAIGAAAFLSERNDIAAEAYLKRVILEACKEGRWSQPYISKYFSYSYPPDSKMRWYAQMYLWPGSLDRGLGKDCLAAALKLANAKYGQNLTGININTVPDEHRINIYFFDPQAIPALARFKNQCAYLGFQNIILCDARFLAQFQEIPLIEKELDKYVRPGKHFSTVLDERQPYYKTNFLLHNLADSHHTLMWALMHEIGHLVNGHRPVSSLQQFLNPSRSKLRAKQMENEADEFALAALESYTNGGRALIVTGLQLVIVGLVAKAIHAPNDTLPVPLHDVNQEIPVKRTTGSHPPMLIRLLNAMIIFERQYPDFGLRPEQTPTFAKLRSQVVLVP